MAVLVDQDRADGTAEFQRDISNTRTVLGAMTKADVRAAFNAADLWADSNAASYNTALPVTFRTNASTSVKALLLIAVLYKRWIKGA